jgi:hypothetical protein
MIFIDHSLCNFGRRQCAPRNRTIFVTEVEIDCGSVTKKKWMLALVLARCQFAS